MVPQRMGRTLGVGGRDSPEGNTGMGSGGGPLPLCTGKRARGKGRNRPPEPGGTEFYMASNAAAPVRVAAKGAHGQGGDGTADAGGGGA